MHIIANVSLSTAVVGVASENEIEVNVSLAIHLYRHFQLKKKQHFKRHQYPQQINHHQHHHHYLHQ